MRVATKQMAAVARRIAHRLFGMGVVFSTLFLLLFDKFFASFFGMPLMRVPFFEEREVHICHV